MKLECVCFFFFFFHQVVIDSRLQMLKNILSLRIEKVLVAHWKRPCYAAREIVRAHLTRQMFTGISRVVIINPHCT